MAGGRSKKRKNRVAVPLYAPPAKKSAQEEPSEQPPLSKKAKAASKPLQVPIAASGVSPPTSNKMTKKKPTGGKAAANAPAVANLTASKPLVVATSHGEAKATGAKPAGAKNTQSKPTAAKATVSKPATPQLVVAKPAVSKPTEAKQAQVYLADPAPDKEPLVAPTAEGTTAKKKKKKKKRKKNKAATVNESAKPEETATVEPTEADKEAASQAQAQARKRRFASEVAVPIAKTTVLLPSAAPSTGSAKKQKLDWAPAPSPEKSVATVSTPDTAEISGPHKDDYQHMPSTTEGSPSMATSASSKVPATTPFEEETTSVVSHAAAETPEVSDDDAGAIDARSSLLSTIMDAFESSRNDGMTPLDDDARHVSGADTESDEPDDADQGAASWRNHSEDDDVIVLDDTDEDEDSGARSSRYHYEHLSATEDDAGDVDEYDDDVSDEETEDIDDDAGGAAVIDDLDETAPSSSVEDPEDEEDTNLFGRNHLPWWPGTSATPLTETSSPVSSLIARAVDKPPVQAASTYFHKTVEETVATSPARAAVVPPVATDTSSPTKPAAASPMKAVAASPRPTAASPTKPPLVASSFKSPTASPVEGTVLLASEPTTAPMIKTDEASPVKPTAVPPTKAPIAHLPPAAPAQTEAKSNLQAPPALVPNTASASWGAAFGTTAPGKTAQIVDCSPLSTWFLSRGQANFIKQSSALPVTVQVPASTDAARQSCPTPRTVADEAFFASLAKSHWRTWYTTADAATASVLDPPLPHVSSPVRAAVEVANTVAAEAPATTEPIKSFDGLLADLRSAKDESSAFEKLMIEVLQGKTMAGIDFHDAYRSVLP
ncbi:hypothetical protein ACHHYP_07949 [Achlya hypogyna]|uniref:Uncharacterized protein n=1 Tax=Achlya hypogyna TaxID=1202772 RepID=A0A1V9YQ70_ACHHY|nr:hypothetical protein ACHHYP_07949 [Achlya hypogyna]